MTRCSIESKKVVGGNIRSNLHKMLGMFSSILTRSFILNVLEHKYLKNQLKSSRALHTNFGNDGKHIGSNHSMKTCQS